MDFTKYTLLELWDIREKLNTEISNIKNRERKKAFRVSTDFELKFFSKRENAINYLIELINDEDEDTHFFSFEEGLEANSVYLDEAEYINFCVDLEK